MESKKEIQRAFRRLLAALAVLLVLTAAFAFYIYTFDHTPRTFSAGDTDEAFTLSIQPRTGQTDSWPKIVKENGQDVDYLGSIYDVTLNNTGECVIADWMLRIDITEEVFLNNAWCGKFEIHQFVDGQERVQTVDLRTFDPAELVVDYTIANPDLMIPLHPGDWIVYHPDYATDEYPIACGDSAKLTQVVFGAIFYTKGQTTPQFTNYRLDYHLQKVYTRSPIFLLLCLGFLTWMVCQIAFASVVLNLRKAHQRFQRDDRIIRQSIGVFTRFFEAKDTYTTGHSQRVGRYARLLAERAGLDEDAVRKTYYIALMHDCGKCYIPDAILKKPGKLTDEEYEIIKSHTVRGAAMLEDFTSIDHVREGALYHHERYDGKGYPEGLAGENIPLVARIICVADSFDAMNSRRCYRDMLTPEYIISEIESNRAKQFDPHLADLFLALIREGKIDFSRDEGEQEE